MKYSVVLQPPFGFALYWIFMGIGLLLAATALGYAIRARLLRRIREWWRGTGLLRPTRIAARKKRHIRRIEKIDTDFRTGRIDSREAHQQMSREVRGFVQDVTGVPVTNLVYSDLQDLNYPALTRLIGEMYEPEFARLSETDIADMIRKSKELIATWQQST